MKLTNPLVTLSVKVILYFGLTCCVTRLFDKKECSCGAYNQKYISNYHYIFDLPLRKILDETENSEVVEMTRTFKRKSNLDNDANCNIAELKGKLFLYFKQIIVHP